MCKYIWKQCIRPHSIWCGQHCLTNASCIYICIGLISSFILLAICYGLSYNGQISQTYEKISNPIEIIISFAAWLWLHKKQSYDQSDKTPNICFIQDNCNDKRVKYFSFRIPLSILIYIISLIKAFINISFGILTLFQVLMVFIQLGILFLLHYEVYYLNVNNKYTKYSTFILYFHYTTLIFSYVFGNVFISISYITISLTLCNTISIFYHIILFIIMQKNSGNTDTYNFEYVLR